MAKFTREKQTLCKNREAVTVFYKTNSDSSVLALDTRDNKLISKSSVFKSKSATDTRDNKLISKSSVFKPKSTDIPETRS